MRFTETEVQGAWIVDPDPIADERGSFARIFDVTEFAAHGITTDVVQANLSRNVHAGTLRGLHLQRAPHAETKLVRCVAGALFDVAVDLRPDSPTYLRWVGVELTADDGRALVVPEGCAHGFLTLADDTVATYQVSAPYTPGAEDGYRYDDPAFGIAWPREVATISEKDASWRAFADRGGDA